MPEIAQHQPLTDQFKRYLEFRGFISYTSVGLTDKFLYASVDTSRSEDEIAAYFTLTTCTSLNSEENSFLVRLNIADISNVSVCGDFKFKDDAAERWWDELEADECRELSKKYGYYGHDQGVTVDEIKWMYKCENND